MRPERLARTPWRRARHRHSSRDDGRQTVTHGTAAPATLASGMPKTVAPQHPAVHYRLNRPSNMPDPAHDPPPRSGPIRIAQIMAGAPVGGAELFFERLSIALKGAGDEVLPVIRRDAGRAARLCEAGLAPAELSFGGPFDRGRAFSERAHATATGPTPSLPRRY